MSYTERADKTVSCFMGIRCFMIRRDFDLEEMKYFLHLVGQSTDDYLYILDLTNDKAVYSKSITNVFALDSEEFSNATNWLKLFIRTILIC